MGLTASSVGRKAWQSKSVQCAVTGERTVAIAGNPNVGKSTLFNALTGMNQHTGNWPGKTVVNAQGCCQTAKHTYRLVDIPGTYSLLAHSAEEEVARNYICFGKTDAVVVVCDATCLERNLNLVLQTIEISRRVVVCVNLLDEAKRKHISIRMEILTQKLGVPVVGVVARRNKSLGKLMDVLDERVIACPDENAYRVRYDRVVEAAIALVQPEVERVVCGRLDARWLSLQLLDFDKSLHAELKTDLGFDPMERSGILHAVDAAKALLKEEGVTSDTFKDRIVSALVDAAHEIAADTVVFEKENYDAGDRRLDRILTSKWTGYPVMLLLLALVFWLTIAGANTPSRLLSEGLFWVEDRLMELFVWLGAPDWLCGAVVTGMYRVLAWVVAVMLPPMAIFFPLFTLLEDSGYLPRVAYNLDRPFQRCCACGKQALTMCMGFGCNAAGVVGCRIIDSPRERLIAMLTNSFMPCNGRFPTLISLITMFMLGATGGFWATGASAVILTLLIVLGVGATFAVSKILSKTILKGIPSSFTLELPPYRKPQIGKVIVRSVLDRTLYVLGRAVVVAAPAGLIIWVLSNVVVGELNLLTHCSNFLDPFAKMLGMDGVILMAFLLGLPANEIVLPIIVMVYMAQGSLMDMDNLVALKELLVSHGWTWVTAGSVMLFSLLHWPCSTTLLTIRKETGGWKWTILAFIIPTLVGIAACMAFAAVGRLLLA